MLARADGRPVRIGCTSTSIRRGGREATGAHAWRADARRHIGPVNLLYFRTFRCLSPEATRDVAARPDARREVSAS